MVIADIFDRMQEAISVFFAWLPSLLGALVILVIGYFVAKILGNIVARVLQRVGLDRTLHSGQAGNWIAKVTSSPSRLLGRITFWAILIGAISLAVTALGIDALTDFVAAIYSYLPNVLMALLIFIVASAIAGGIAGLVQRTMGDTGLGRIVSTVVPVIIMAIAGFMILDALEIASTIVTITYAALMGSIGLGMALAFGLGGREVAAQMLQGAYERGQANSGQWKRDLEQGREQARRDAERVKAEAQDRAEGDDLSAREATTRVVTPNERRDTVVEPGTTTRP